MFDIVLSTNIDEINAHIIEDTKYNSTTLNLQTFSGEKSFE